MSDNITQLHKLLTAKAREDKRDKLSNLSYKLLEEMRVNGVIDKHYTFNVKNNDGSVITFSTTLRSLINQGIESYLDATQTQREQNTLRDFLSKVDSFANQLTYIQQHMQDIEGDH